MTDLFPRWLYHFIFPPGVYDRPSCSTSPQTLDIPKIQTKVCIIPEHTCLALFLPVGVRICVPFALRAPAHFWARGSLLNASSSADLGQVSSLPWTSVSFSMTRSLGEGDCSASFQGWHFLAAFPVYVLSWFPFLSVTRHCVIDYISTTALENSLYFFFFKRL